MASEYWTLEGSRAVLRCAGLVAQVEADAPHHGIQPLLDTNSAEVPCRLLALLASRDDGQQPPELAECFIRGTDFVAAYSPVLPKTVQPHIYWRLLQDPALQAVGVELIVSMQTSLLDSDPASIVLSEIPPGEIWRLADPAGDDFSYLALDPSMPLVEETSPGASLLVLRPEGEAASYAQMIHPSDFVGHQLDLKYSPAPRVQIRSPLFPEHLEKGVIRRGRACGWFLPRSGDLQAAAELYRRFVAEPPPLTA